MENRVVEFVAWAGAGKTTIVRAIEAQNRGTGVRVKAVHAYHVGSVTALVREPAWLLRSLILIWRLGGGRRLFGKSAVNYVAVVGASRWANRQARRHDSTWYMFDQCVLQGLRRLAGEVSVPMHEIIRCYGTLIPTPARVVAIDLPFDSIVARRAERDGYSRKTSRERFLRSWSDTLKALGELETGGYSNVKTLVLDGRLPVSRSAEVVRHWLTN
jgi:thymidylate kinase